MKIVGLKAENFKRLKAVELSPDGTTVVIAGRNAQGKSSVLDAIWAALAGKNGVKEVVRPIRDGESRAAVVIELDELRVERKWTPSGSTLTVGPRDGKSKFNSPQRILDDLIGQLSFDPLAFAEADARTQRAELLRISGLQDQVDELDRQYQATFEERTDVNRELKRFRAQLDAIPDSAREPVEKVDVTALVGQLGTARRRQELADEWTRLNAEITRLQTRRSEVELEGRRLVGVDPVEVIEQQIADGCAINQAAEMHRRWVELANEVSDAEQTSAGLSSTLAEVNAAKAHILTTAPLPVDGLGVDDDGVTYRGVPLVQASAAERLKVSVGMAMAANPQVRVICIKDASLLDPDSRQLLADMAAEHDFQVWYEVVGDGGPTGIVIEDGEVQS